jgi:hypothetical protein
MIIIIMTRQLTAFWYNNMMMSEFIVESMESFDFFGLNLIEFGN